ncbi:MAG TPA: FliM/FliN family flagellar motor switch protein [Kineosporiaceae bacterium]|nr:FliM/FliN family flagellar motor switch protein [Kineosporiaceae bacterium]
MGYSEQATAYSRRRRGEPRAYDFRRPVRLARDQAHLLRIAMQTFGRQSSTVLTTSLRVVCALGSPTIEELSYDQYLTGLPDQAVCAVVALEPWAGKSLLTIELPTLLTMVDHLLGGPGADRQPDRPLTDIEQALLRHLLTRTLRELSYALEPLDHVEPQLQNLESNPGFVQAAAPTDPVVVGRLELTVGERTGSASLCIPYASLEPALERLTRAQDDEARLLARRQAAQRTQQRLTDVEVEVAVRFNPTRLPSAAIGRLAVGDVVRLEHRTTAPLAVTAAATTFAQAVPGTSGRRLAVLIVPSPLPGRPAAAAHAAHRPDAEDP